MPEDNYLECINAIAETMKGTNWKGEWYGKRGFFFIFFTFEKVLQGVTLFLRVCTVVINNGYVESDENNKLSFC